MPRLRVDTIPLLLKPFFGLWAYSTAIISYAILAVFRLLTRVHVRGKEQLPEGSHIYAIWHENLVLYFICHLRYREPYAWMNHPAWFMKPVHIILRFMGLKKLFLGSTGNNGRQAMEQVAAHVRQGYHTLIACDGPAGPYHDLKYGVLEMSRISGRPVVPIHFSCRYHWRWFGWDKKVLPLPFATITMTYQQPMVVSGDEQQAGTYIARAMGR